MTCQHNWHFQPDGTLQCQRCGTHTGPRTQDILANTTLFGMRYTPTTGETTMRPAEFSTPNPPTPVENQELAGYIFDLRRRIEVQNDQMEALANQALTLLNKVKHLQEEIDRLSLDLGVKNGEAGPGWDKVPT